MKPSTFGFRLLPVMLALLTALAAPAYSYVINLTWLGEYEPVVFSVGRFITGDLSEVTDIWKTMDPFFGIEVYDVNPADPDSLYLWVRMETGGRETIFSVRSGLFDVREQLADKGRLTNRDLANNPALDFEDLAPETIMPYLDGGSIREGYYILTVVLESPTGENLGIGIRTILVRNPSQVRLELPEDGSILGTNPIFIWSFPREVGVGFLLELVAGGEGDDPWNAIEFANPSNIYATILIPVEWPTGGELNTYIYTGTGSERLLDPGTYFWRVSATAPGMFPGEFHTIQSDAYAFAYNPPGAGGEGAGGIRGALPGAGGGGEENPPPGENPIFTLLRYLLTEEQIQSILAQFGDPGQWSVTSIFIDDRQVNLQELVNYLLGGNRTIVLVAVSQ